MSTITIEITQRELRALVHALDIARDQSINPCWNWWRNTRYADALYYRLWAL